LGQDLLYVDYEIFQKIPHPAPSFSGSQKHFLNMNFYNTRRSTYSRPNCAVPFFVLLFSNYSRWTFHIFL